MFNFKNKVFPEQKRKEKIQSDAIVVELKKNNVDQAADENAKRETFRLASFKKCKIAVTEYDLAVAGFYYVGPSDRVRCFSCGSCVQSWKPNDDVFSHRWHTSQCKHFLKQNSGNLQITAIQDASTYEEGKNKTMNFPSDVSSHSQLNIAKKLDTYQFVQKIAPVYSVEHQNFIESLSLNNEEDRLKTFVSKIWPKDLKGLIEPLARTGFFYLGNADRTQCFSCGAVQRNWHPEDDVRSIHAQWFKECRMLRNTEDKNIPLKKDFFRNENMSTSALFLPSLDNAEAKAYKMATSSAESSLDINIYDRFSEDQDNTTANVSILVSESNEMLPVEIRAPPECGLDEESSLPVERQNSRSSAGLLDSNFVTPQFSLDAESLTLNLPNNPSEYSVVSTRIDKSLPENLLSPACNPAEPVYQAQTAFQQRSNVSMQRHTSSPHPSSTAAILPNVSAFSQNETETSHLTVLSPSYPPSVPPSSSVQSFEVSDLPSPLFARHLSTSVQNPSRISVFNQGQRIASQAPTNETNLSLLQELDPFAPVARSLGSASETTPLPESELDVDDMFVDSDMKVLLKDMYPCQIPVNRDMVYLSLRLSSFRQPWPENASVSTITQTAQAGFYYLGTGDSVRCWYCGIEASNWACKQDAWVMHAYMFPSCQYLLRNRGSDYVETVLSQVSNTDRPESSRLDENASAIGESSLEDPLSFESELNFGAVQSGPDRLRTPPIVDPRNEAAQKKEELRRSMRSDIVQKAVSMGFSRNHIRQVVKKQIDQHACSYLSFEALLDALIFTPENLIDLSSDEEDEDPAVNLPEDNALEELDDSVELYQGSIAASVEAQEQSGNSFSVPSGGGSSREYLERSRLSSSSIENEELRRLRHEKRCKICLDRDANLVFVPCGHICACERCTHSLRQCPLCRKRIEKAYKTYSS